MIFVILVRKKRKAIHSITLMKVYNADRLTAILTEVSRIIGANILNVAKQDYDPQGASVNNLNF